MQSLTFVLASPLLAPLVEFATSTSGHVEPRQGLALGWLSSVVAGLAVVFGTADRAQADSCQGIPDSGDLSENCKSICQMDKLRCSWVCLKDKPCRFDSNGKAVDWYRAKYCNLEKKGCQQVGNWSCSC